MINENNMVIKIGKELFKTKDTVAENNRQQRKYDLKHFFITSMGALEPNKKGLQLVNPKSVGVSFP